MQRVVGLEYEGLGMSVWGPSYEEVLEEAKARKARKRQGALVMWFDLANSPDAPQPEVLVRGKKAYQSYLKELALDFARKGLIPVGSERDYPRVQLHIHLFVDAEKRNYLEWEGEIRAEETLAPLHIRGKRWEAKGKVVARLGDPVGLFVGERNPHWKQEGYFTEWRALWRAAVERVESLEQVRKEAERLLLRVEGDLDPEGEYALVSYLPERTPGWYHFYPLAPCTLAEAEVIPQGRDS